ncbi:NUDIX domain-containing protein [Halorarius halobius]|uniref:NUDIX domain-containing protein n=1 Tax=Halorarius halobius TaxID=2962671 RepID=UPI0020CBA984|nr:NUDIX hydrolase [Halorarius halobius]
MHDLTRRSRERTDEVLVDHAADYGRFRVREPEWELSPVDHDRVRERFEAGADGGAGVWVTRDDSVLLVRHADETAWSDPGGKRAAGETFAEAARRETREEAGVDVDIGGVVELHAVSHVAPDRPRLVSPIVVFAGSYAGGEPAPDEGDRVAAARWFTERPDDLLYDALAEFPWPTDNG